ncbi:hypothetical protein [Sphingomonas sp.]|nr:hypothetical protein [Sphingomonas sp.]
MFIATNLFTDTTIGQTRARGKGCMAAENYFASDPIRPDEAAG